MNFNRPIFRKLALCGAVALGLTACSDDPEPLYDVTFSENVPEGCTITSQTINFTELNTGATTTVTGTAGLSLGAGTYSVDATAEATDASGNKKTLRAVARNIVITATAHSVTLDWFYYNATSTFVFSEIYTSGSLNATGKGKLYDSYFRIYNNTDEVLYADGLAICESAMNSATNIQSIVTEAARPENNFITQVVYVIPGNGTDVPVQPGQSIKIADQAIDWSEQVAGALDHRDADFEWYDEVTTGSLRDTNNPDVPDLDKWYSYSRTIWLPSQQCNRAYALVRMPSGMTAENYLSNYDGTYSYIGVTGKEMTNKNACIIPNDWILDGVSLCSDTDFRMAVISPAVDMSHASIALENTVANSAGKKFVRLTAGTSPAGNTILQDTDDSANDFEVVSAR